MPFTWLFVSYLFGSLLNYVLFGVILFLVGSYYSIFLSCGLNAIVISPLGVLGVLLSSGGGGVYHLFLNFWDAYFVVRYLFSYQLYCIAFMFVCLCIFILQIRVYPNRGFSLSSRFAIFFLSFRNFVWVLTIFFFYLAYDDILYFGTLGVDFIANQQSNTFSQLFDGNIITLYVPIHTAIVLLAFNICLICTIAVAQLANLCPHFVSYSMYAWFSNFFLLCGISIFFGGLWSLYNDFSLLFWSWDYIELFFLELFYAYVIFTHIVFLGLFSYELLCVGLLLFRFFRFSVLESMHHLSSVLQNITYDQHLYGGIFASARGYYPLSPMTVLEHGAVRGVMLSPYSSGDEFMFAQVFALIFVILILFYAGGVCVAGGSGNSNLLRFNNYLINWSYCGRYNYYVWYVIVIYAYYLGFFLFLLASIAGFSGVVTAGIFFFLFRVQVIYYFWLLLGFIFIFLFRYGVFICGLFRELFTSALLYALPPLMCLLLYVVFLCTGRIVLLFSHTAVGFVFLIFNALSLFYYRVILALLAGISHYLSLAFFFLFGLFINNWYLVCWFFIKLFYKVFSYTLYFVFFYLLYYLYAVISGFLAVCALLLQLLYKYFLIFCWGYGAMFFFVGVDIVFYRGYLCNCTSGITFGDIVYIDAFWMSDYPGNWYSLLFSSLIIFFSLIIIPALYRCVYITLGALYYAYCVWGIIYLELFAFTVDFLGDNFVRVESLTIVRPLQWVGVYLRNQYLLVQVHRFACYVCVRVYSRCLYLYSSIGGFIFICLDWMSCFRFLVLLVIGFCYISAQMGLLLLLRYAYLCCFYYCEVGYNNYCLFFYPLSGTTGSNTFGGLPLVPLSVAPRIAYYYRWGGGHNSSGGSNTLSSIFTHLTIICFFLALTGVLVNIYIDFGSYYSTNDGIERGLLCDGFFFSFFLFPGVYVDQLFFFSGTSVSGTFCLNNYSSNAGFTLDLHKLITSNAVFLGFVGGMLGLLTPGNAVAIANFCSDLFGINSISISRYGGWCNSGVSTFQFLRSYGDGGGGVGVLGFAALALDTLFGQGMASVNVISHYAISGGGYLIPALGIQDLCYVGLRWYEVEFCICLYWVILWSYRIWMSFRFGDYYLGSGEGGYGGRGSYWW